MQETAPCLGARAYLGPGRAQSVRDLVGVASLHPAATFAATADPDPKTRRHRLHLADVYLPLLGVAFVLDVTAAERAARREAGVELQIWRAGGRHAVTVTTVRFAGLAPGPARLVFRPAFGKWRRLAFAGPSGLGQGFFELLYALVLGGKCLVLLGNLCAQAVDRLLEAGDYCFQLGDTLVKTHAHLVTK